jgi:hypothetical protein
LVAQKKKRIDLYAIAVKGRKEKGKSGPFFLQYQVLDKILDGGLLIFASFSVNKAIAKSEELALEQFFI